MTSKLLAPVRGWEARRALRAERRRADEEILATRLPSPRLAWRVEELVSEQNRIALGRSLTDIVHSSDERLLPTASPLDRGAIRSCRAQLLELAARLCDLDRSVSGRGVLLTERLVADGSGPLYGGHGPEGLRREITEVAAVLDDPAH